VKALLDSSAGSLKGMHFEEHVRLARFTTLGVGGEAHWFARAVTEADVADAVAFAQDRQVPLFVLGGGSNLLISDEGFPGLVLQMGIASVERVDDVMHVGAGVLWDAFVQQTVNAGLQGIECLAGIPGTVGGTPVQNVGAYGQEVSETIVSVRCFDTTTSQYVELSNAECGFAYRTSQFNTTERGRYIVTRVDFRLHESGVPCLKYADLKKLFEGKTAPLLAGVAEAVRTIRRGKGMVVDAGDPNSRSAGSFFRNPIVGEELLLKVSEAAGISVDAVPHWPAGEGLIKLPAAWLLEQAGFVRGYAMGRAGISSRHTLAVINRGDATAADIIALRERIIETVRLKFGIELEQEPVSVG
jgi:UDP-N-acetylmuramate dehydrogenase